jgi:hypothetical protein
MNKLYLTLILSLLPTVSFAGNWIADQNGCEAWNGNPQPNESIAWTGGCSNGKMNGNGTLQWYKDGQKNERYEGQYKDGKLNGQGVYTWANGDRYEGQWKDDKKNGQGEFTWANGNRYDGQYKDGKENGQGEFTWADGSSYEGQFKDGQRGGFGTMRLPKGNESIANYEHNGHGKWVGNTYVVTATFSADGVTEADSDNPQARALGMVANGLFGYTKDILSGKVLADTVGTVKNVPRISDAKSACLDRCDADERNTKAGCIGLNDNFKPIGLNDKDECNYQAGMALDSCKNSCYAMP